MILPIIDDERYVNNPEPIKVLFLDIDGVLNGYGPIIISVFRLAERIHLLEVLKRYYKIFGVHRAKVRRLSKIVKATGSKIVLSSTWRGAYFSSAKNAPDNIILLKKRFKEYGIEVIGSTPDIDTNIIRVPNNMRREFEIRSWLHQAEEYYGITVSRFAILDDEQFDLQGFVEKELVQTSWRNTIMKRGPSRWTGLRRRHVKKVIEILNG